MIRVGLIGCGKIADDHVEQIRRIPTAEIVGVCDKEELMARQLSERFQVPRRYDDVREFLAGCRPEVVHITTPPQSHFELAKACLESGCHVYLEKPFTVTTKEATELIEFAKSSLRHVTVGHDYQFTHAKRRMRKLIANGYLGGPPIHMESYHCYELGSQRYARALLGDKNHWVRTLPGTLMHNNISHGIGSIAEYIGDGEINVAATCFRSRLLEDAGETEIVDEARAIITTDRLASAYFTFSTQIRPVLHQFRIYGKSNGLIVDHDQQTCIRIDGQRRKSYLEKFFSPLVLSRRYAADALGNMSLFLKRDFHMKSGMKYLIESFYRSIRGEGPPPIPYGEILATSRIMDAIFAQIRCLPNRPHADATQARVPL